MQRREFMTSVGTAAAAIAAQHAFKPSAALARASIAPSTSPARYDALEDAARHCLATGEDCLRHCFGILATKDTSTTACTKLVYEVIAACRALRTLVAINSAHVPIFAEAVAQLCDDCRQECEKFSWIAECKECGEACQKCAEKCRGLVRS